MEGSKDANSVAGDEELSGNMDFISADNASEKKPKKLDLKNTIERGKCDVK